MAANPNSASPDRDWRLNRRERVVAFDLKGYLRTQQALLANGEITEAQWQQRLDRLEQVFLELPPNRTILLKEVVLKNGREPELRIP